MKKDFLIKQIASEFNVDEIKVSEYFDGIFETLAAAFIKNKNVNLSEFGKFSVKKKTDEEGERKKTVLFSPVRKFAEEINYNFGELKPVQIRLLDSAASPEYQSIEPEEEAEEILIIDFEDLAISSSESEEVLIHEDSEPEVPVLETEMQKEKILIPESDKPEIPTLKTEERKEEILIHEKPRAEIYTERIPEEIDSEVKVKPGEEVIPYNIEVEKARIIEVINSVKFPERIPEFTAQGTKEFKTAAKIISREATAYIKDEKPETIIPLTDKIEEEIEQLKAFITEEIQEENITTEETPVSAGNREEEITGESKQDIFAEEKSEEIITGQQKEETPKTSLELEAELLQMLEERKKILEEISRLEKSDTDDVVDISGPKTTEEEKPKLHDESTLDRPRQNVFADDEGKILEELLGLISGEGKTDLTGQAEIPPEEKNVSSENFIQEEKEEIKHGEEEKKESESGEKQEDIISGTDAGLIKPDNIFEDLFDKPAEEQTAPETEEIKVPSFNAEMKIFDRLLDEPIIPSAEEKPEKDENGLTSFSELEEMFRSFKTETDEEKTVSQKPAESEPAAIQEKTETIKTYDDITNLIDVKPEKKAAEPAAEEQESPKKKITPAARMAIVMVTLLIAIIVFVILYQKFVNKSPEQNMQIPVPHPADSTQTKGSDSVIYADTNKSAGQEEAETVFEKDGKLIKETSKGFYIEFGEYDNQFVLAKEIKALKDKGITPGYEEVKSEGRTYYIMKLGPYNSLKEAKSILSKL